MGMPRRIVVAAAGVSVVCSLLLLLCFLLPKWRARPRGAKHVLLAATISNIVMAAAYLLSPGNPTQCVLQASLQQFFEIACSWAYTALVAVELALGLADVNHRARTVPMHVAVVAYAGVSTALLFALKKDGRAGEWCWSPDAVWQLVSYFVLWVELAAIAASTVAILRTMRRLHGHLAYAVARLAAIPLLWILLHVPGSIRRCHALLKVDCAWCESQTMNALQSLCDPSQGTLNFLLFGLADRHLNRELRRLFANPPPKPRGDATTLSLTPINSPHKITRLNPQV